MNPLTTLRQSLFSMVHGKALIYNQCWEDPRLDRVAMQLNSTDRVLVITSAGCNALDYVLEGPAHVHAVDLNPRQNALLELKIAGIRSLNHAAFFSIFGMGQCSEFADIYWDQMRRHLSSSAKKFWDERTHVFDGRNRRGSFYFHGTTGWVAWLMNQYIDRVARIRDTMDRIFSVDSLGEQREMYDSIIRPAIWGRSLRWVMRRDTTMALLGVPRPQRDQIDRDYRGGVAQFIQDCIDYVFRALPLGDNYFWRVYLTGSYAPRCCPEYLKVENFEHLKSLVDRITVHTDSVAGFLQRSDVGISRFVLLDHQDWLCSYAHAELEREWNAILRRATADARVLWRSAGTQTDFIDRIEATHENRKIRLRDALCYQRELAGNLHERDRVHTYGSFHVADVRLA